MDSPIDGASINHLNFSFTISEPIFNGQLIFTDENGQIGKHPLSADQLNTLVLVDDPLFIPVNLQDGSTYSLKLIGADVAGNSADSDIQNGIHYDITKPSFSINTPKGGGVYIGSNISYSLSEDIASGTATWMRVSGKPDPLSPHNITLNTEENSVGDHNNTKLTNQSKLNLVSVYSLTMKGIDAA